MNKGEQKEQPRQTSNRIAVDSSVQGSAKCLRADPRDKEEVGVDAPTGNTSRRKKYSPLIIGQPPHQPLPCVRQPIPAEHQRWERNKRPGIYHNATPIGSPISAPTGRQTRSERKGLLRAMSTPGSLKSA